MTNIEQLQSSIAQVTDFKESVVWTDLTLLLTERIDLMRDMLETELDVEKIRVIQGQIKAYREMLDLPTIVIQAIEIQNEELKQN